LEWKKQSSRRNKIYFLVHSERSWKKAPRVRTFVLSLLLVVAGCRAKDPPLKGGVNLEFRIVANESDDKEALEASRKFFLDAPMDPTRKAELDKLAQEGKPPPASKPPEGKATWPNGFLYTWFELSAVERRNLKLEPDWDGTVEANPMGVDLGEAAEETAIRKNIEQARTKGEAVLLSGQRGLLYSRVCRNSTLTEEERRKKKFDYFLLLRDPAKDKAITGEFLVRVQETKDDRNKSVIRFALDAEGGDRFYELTSKNLPTGPKGFEVYRCLAIILDGQVMSAPRVNSAIRQEGMISGNFTKEETAAMMKVLRGE
jgi:hypothetical protein